MTTEQRVKRLERSNLGLAVALVVAIGAGAAQKAPRDLRAEKLTITDPQGRARVVIRASDRYAGLWVFDTAMNQTLTLGTTDTNASRLALYEPGKDHERVEVALQPGGTAEVAVADPNGRGVRMAASDQFRPVVEFRSGERITHAVP